MKNEKDNILSDYYHSIILIIMHHYFRVHLCIQFVSYDMCIRLKTTDYTGIVWVKIFLIRFYSI